MTATDSHNNSATKTFVVNVVDTTPPDLNVPADIVVGATDANGAVVDFAGQVSAADLVDGSITPVCSRASGSVFPIGTTTVGVTATDAHGNAGTATFDVTVRTPEAVIDCLPTRDTREGDVLVLYGGRSTIPEGKIEGVTYRWTVAKDGMDTREYEGMAQFLLLPEPGDLHRQPDRDERQRCSAHRFTRCGGGSVSCSDQSHPCRGALRQARGDQGSFFSILVGCRSMPPTGRRPAPR